MDKFSRSSPISYRQRMYSLGVFSRCISKWWNACCATYAMRRLGCFHTSPDDGSISPVSSLIMVDLPAPLAPSTATRELRQHCTETPDRMTRSEPGYENETSFILMMARSFDLTPSRNDGSGSTNLMDVAPSS